MFNDLPTDARTALDWPWSAYEPYMQELLARELTAENVEAWLADWSRLIRLVGEVGARIYVAHNQDTNDAEAENRFLQFIEEVQPEVEAADQQLKEKLLDSGLEPAGLSIPLRNLRAETELFREENLSLFTETRKLTAEYSKIIAAQTVMWEGEETPLPQLVPLLHKPDRATREQVWRLMHERTLADREALNGLWQELFALRDRIAANAGRDHYRDYAWQQRLRFDYTPEDAITFQEAIATVVVPAATRIYERRRQALGLDRLRPWDLVDGTWRQPPEPAGQTTLAPYQTAEELLNKGVRIFERVDPVLGEQFQIMIDEALLDVENRKGKAPGGYCTYFATMRRPFIFMNAVGLHGDVQTLLHEAGHAFHNFARAELPFHVQHRSPMEFNEVASMAMELLAAPYLGGNGNGFYNTVDAARARREHLEEMILFWSYMAVVDAFQHWAYTHEEQAADPARCDAQWATLWQRFLPGVDWSGLEAEMETGWHRKSHIFHSPFYYIEYGLAALGAAQVWRNALQDQEQAVASYRQALALGGTAPLPELFATAGARFAFDAETVGDVVTLIEDTLHDLDTQIAAGVS